MYTLSLDPIYTKREPRHIRRRDHIREREKEREDSCLTCLLASALPRVLFSATDSYTDIKMVSGTVA